MKKIIHGKKYDTGTASLVHTACFGEPASFGYFEETLYRKHTGEYFMHGRGGPASRYSVSVGQNSWSGGEKIVPLSLTEAKAWAEKTMDADEYEAEFGPVEE